MPFLKKQEAIDRNRTVAYKQAELLDLMRWTEAEYRAAQALGLQTTTVIVDRAWRASDPRNQVFEEKRVHTSALLAWLELLTTLGVTHVGKVAIADLLGA